MNIKYSTLQLSVTALFFTSACGDDSIIDLGSTYLKSGLISARAPTTRA